MCFQIFALPADPFTHLYGRTDEELRGLGVMPYIADTPTGFPCRVSLRDASEGERLLLLNYEHLPTDSPYRSRHAIFVSDGAQQSHLAPDEVPAMLATRLLSVRSFDTSDMMIAADIVEGAEAGDLFRQLLADPAAEYLHVHTARRGCYMAEAKRG